MIWGFNLDSSHHIFPSCHSTEKKDIDVPVFPPLPATLPYAPFPQFSQGCLSQDLTGRICQSYKISSSYVKFQYLFEFSRDKMNELKETNSKKLLGILMFLNLFPCRKFPLPHLFENSIPTHRRLSSFMGCAGL